MKILALAGSPKGELSVTLQYARYLGKRFPRHELRVEHVGQRIRLLEREPARFDAVVAAVREADLVLWTTPVFYMLVPGQLKRFIELVFERGAAEAFAGRSAAAITTSIHFFDHTAHAYLAGVSEDLGMAYRGGHSAGMPDLMKAQGRRQLERFAEQVFGAVEAGDPAPVTQAPIAPVAAEYRPGPSAPKVDQGPLRVLVVADRDERSPNLARMVDRVAARLARPPEIVDLAALDVAGGCLGCLRCGLDNRCAYEGKDAFIPFFAGKVMAADVLFFAGAIRDRHLSSRWKTFFDRSFFRGHAPSLAGRQIAWVISGPLRQLPNLRQILEGYAELQEANLSGIATDEDAEPGRVEALLDALVARALDDAAAGTRAPHTFLGVAGHKLFRDAVWGELRFVFQADHRRYGELGYYDFPQRRVARRLANLAAPLLRVPAVRKRYEPRIREGMVAPLKRVVEKAGPKEVA